MNDAQHGASAGQVAEPKAIYVSATVGEGTVVVVTIDLKGAKPSLLHFGCDCLVWDAATDASVLARRPAKVALS